LTLGQMLVAAVPGAAGSGDRPERSTHYTRRLDAAVPNCPLAARD
jgi:hypothetical protein